MTVYCCTAYIGVDAGQLGAALLSHDKELNVLALSLGAGNHLLDRASHERVDTWSEREKTYKIASGVGEIFRRNTIRHHALMQIPQIGKTTLQDN